MNRLTSGDCVRPEFLVYASVTRAILCWPGHQFKLNSLGDHGLVHKGCRFHENAAPVPLLISWPASFRTRVCDSGLTELVDVTPTILDTLDLPRPDYLQGESRLGILEGRSDRSVRLQRK